MVFLIAFAAVVIMGIIGAALRTIINLLVSFAVEPVGTLLLIVRLAAAGTTVFAAIFFFVLHVGSALPVAIIAAVLWAATFKIPNMINDKRARFDNADEIQQW